MDVRPPKQYKSTLISKDKISAKVYKAVFKLVDPPTIEFTAGQFIMLMVGPGINRSMSIASTPRENTQITIWHDISPMGPGSQWMLNLPVGATAEFKGPLGVFVLDKESHRKKVLVATGTGVAPFYSMIVDYVSNGGTDDITLYWGLRFEEDLFAQAELSSLSQHYPNFRFVISLSKPTDTWQGQKGHITDQVFAQEQNLPGSDIYLCGNQAMVKEMKEGLVRRGVPQAQIKTELFF